MKNLTGIYLFVPLWGTKTEKPTGSRKPVLYFLIIKYYKIKNLVYNTS
jgi:hypothetical protein